MKKSLLLGCLLSVSIYANAFTTSSGPFYLAGGTVPPKGQFAGILNISLESLPRNVTLDITCDIENPNYYNPYPVVIGFYNGSLNGKSSPTNQYLLNNEVSKYASRILIDGTSPQGNPSIIRFTNYDTTDSVYVENCMAVYATS